MYPSQLHNQNIASFVEFFPTEKQSISEFDLAVSVNVDFYCKQDFLKIPFIDKKKQPAFFDFPVTLQRSSCDVAIHQILMLQC